MIESMMARDGVEPPPAFFGLALMSIYNDLTGLRWLRKCLKVAGDTPILGGDPGRGGQQLCGADDSPRIRMNTGDLQHRDPY